MSDDRDDFYVAGGTVGPEAPSYVSRRADVELFEALSRGEFCYVLTSRQMGKSSLSVRVAAGLRESGAMVARLDVSVISGKHNSPEQWYDGLLLQLGEELGLEAELEAYWLSHGRLAPVLRFMSAIRQVILEGCPGPVSIFIDEIDSVRSLSFSTDEFFAAIREFYNRRADDPALRRLSFCLLGVASPADLIQDPRTTPFNVGRRIELVDFTPDESSPLALGLGRDPATADRLLARILHWTHGHPYLTQRLCREVLDKPAVVDAGGVDRLCESLFFSGRARDSDDNLIFVRERLLRVDEASRSRLLKLYAKVRRNGRVADDEANPRVELLRLSGITRVVAGRLKVRNRIYRRVFDRRWVRSNLPKSYRQAFLRGVVLATLVSVVVLGAIGGYAYKWFESHRWTKVEYYNTFVKRWGVYEGVGRLSEDFVRHRFASLKFYRRGSQGPVEKIEVVNHHGQVVDPTGLLPGLMNHVENYLTNSHESDQDEVVNETCRWELIRDARDRILYEIGRDKAGRLTHGLLYVPSDRRDEVIGHYLDRNGLLQARNDLGAASVRISRDAEGFDRKVVFLGRDGKPTKDENGSYAEVRGVGPTGLVASVTCLGPDGEPHTRKDSFHKAMLEYDSMGNPMVVRSFGGDGKPVSSATNAPILRMNFDSWGRYAGHSTHDLSGSIIPIEGAAWTTREYDLASNQTVQSTFDRPDSLPREGRNPLRERNIFDARGNLVEANWTDSEGRPHRNADGYARRRMTHDDHDRLAADTFWGMDGSLGFTREDRKFNVAGHLVEMSYRDENGAPARHKDGNRGFTNTAFNERGGVIERVLWGYDATESGYSRCRSRYDAKDNLIEIAYFDDAGAPARTREGYRGFTNTAFDEKGIVTADILWGYDGSQGFAKQARKLDPRGIVVEVAYLDDNDKPVRHKDGHRGFTNTAFDAKGTMIEKVQWGYDAAELGYSRCRYRFDAQGRVVEMACLDEEGKPARNKVGWCGFTNITFDEKGGPIERILWGYDAKETGYSRSRHRQDAKGQAVEMAYLDDDGNPAQNKQGWCGFTNTAFDEKGVATADILWGYDGSQGYVKQARKLDSRGNAVEVAYLDGDDKPARHKYGNRGLTNTAFDEKGAVTAAVLWGYDGSMGYAKQARKLDARGNIVEVAYLDDGGKPARHKDGNRGLTNTAFDDKGGLVERVQWGYDPKETGYSSCRYRYDAKDNLVELAYFDDAGAPARHKDGYQGFTNTAFDEKGAVTADILWGYDGSQGFAKQSRKLDPRGNIVEVAYLDDAGAATRGNDGNLGWSKSFDERGILREGEDWGFDGSLGFSRIHGQYDDQGSIAVLDYRDREGRPAATAMGYSKISFAKKMAGLPDDMKYYELDGRVVPVRKRVFVTQVIPGGEGARVGLRAGDVFLEYDGAEAQDAASFIKAVQVPGETERVLRYRREGQVLDVRVKPGRLNVRLEDRAVKEENGAGRHG